MNDEQMQSLLDRMARAGWLSFIHYEDGKRFRLQWTHEGADQAEQVIGLAKLNNVSLESGKDFLPLPDVLAKTLFWKLVASKVQKDGQALSKDEENALFHVLVNWKN